MKNKVLTGILVFLFTMGCAHMMSLEEREKLYGKESPVIKEVFASKQIKPADPWKIYLRAFDPDGDMDAIVAVVDLAGSGPHPVSYTRIAEGNRKELAGFVTLNTSNPSGDAWLNGLSLTLTVRIRDRAGHLSNEAVFPLDLNFRYKQAPPPPNLFPEQNLGPILVILRSFHDDGGSGDGFF